MRSEEPAGWGNFQYLIRITDDQGALKWYEKVIGELTFEGDTFSGDAAGLIYLPTQDPLAPDEVPLMTVSGPITGRRIPVVTIP